MKVVINKCYGGFGLSDKAVEACIALGMTVGDENSEGKDFVKFSKPQFGHCYLEMGRTKKIRCDPRVVQVVEQLGSEAYGDFAELKVVEIPFYGPDGWDIEEHDGMEWIAETHSNWQ
jgi:hypothetical protein